MISKIYKLNRSPRRSKEKVNNLQILQSVVKWQHLEYTATSLLDIFATIFNHQALILSVNSSFVDPLMQFETQLKIIESSFKIVFAMPTLKEVKDIGNTETEEQDLEELYQTILNIYEDTLLILVSKDLYKLQILKEMAVWMSEDKSYLQHRVLVIICRVLNFASRKVKGYGSVDAPCLGDLAAELSLLCSHTDASITQQASFGIYHLLCIANCQNESKATKCDKSGSHSWLPSLLDIEYLPDILRGDKTKIAQSVGQTLGPTLLTDFVWNLFMRLNAKDPVMAKEAATILKLTLEYHAKKVTMVSKIVHAIYQQLSGNSPHAMRHAMLRVITLLTRTSPKKVIFQLMDYPVPADNTLILMWHAAGNESSVAPYVLKTILLILKGKPGEMQDTILERRRSSLDATNMMPVAASQALCTLLPVGSYKKAVAQFFPQLLMALMFQLCYSSNMQLDSEDNLFYARDALRVLLNCSGLQQVDLSLKRKNFWKQVSQVLFHLHGIYLVAKTLAEHNFPQFPETLHYLYKLSVEGPRRTEEGVITVIFLTELLNKFFKDPFPEEFLVLFRNWVNDSNPAISKLSLQKIASMAPVINQVESVCSLVLSILDAFFSKDKTVVIRALFTLRRLLNKLDKVIYSSLCTRIATSYCPLMDHSDAGIRSMAIRHFGELLEDMSQYTWMLNAVILESLVPLILFLEDIETRVVMACKHTLTICAFQLKWSTFPRSIEHYSFELVVLNICNNIFISHGSYITDLLSDSLGFLRSSRVYLRRAAIILIGYLAILGRHLLLRDDIEVIMEAVERVLLDEDRLVRELAKTTYELFKKVARKMTSSIIKQSFRRLFNFIYISKVKPLYNYNLPGSLKEIEETDNYENKVEE
ncbi:maestro heat-like repeat-containing protein family member 9 [Eptesicus fuscus]|uniref:maestro heat-like repeat-containing protein family member 9 n=1 Tax=Eptesicus fuscus TaxID=29078 RepID=UPI002403AD7A|nr:maestro heat-like repeat-containing protein family member 9 [Eptesicus fuscus]